MGTFQVQMQIGDPQGQRFESIDALLDSGATYSTIPASLLRGLGVTPHGTRRFALADGSRIEMDFGRTWVRLEGTEEIVPVIFGDDDSLPLLGAVTLEIFSLGIDPVNARLIPVDGLLMRARRPRN